MINITVLTFYILSAVLLSSAVMVVTARNTVYGVLFLILGFFNAAGLFILAHAEFLSMILVVVYVGAVAVLFLFVVMMLNVELGQLRESIKSYSLIGGLVGGILGLELVGMMAIWSTSPEAFDLTSAPFANYGNVSNTQALGNLLYTHYALVFQGAGLILLIAMIGAIVLTLRQREGVKKQSLGDQIGRQAKESVRLVDIPSGSGI
ncbi:MAG TPA: NADH-quinone oxidoreductase subunit J [Alphaproteobacteria bacterium]|nr:NADH-quinone oxidoreductase subunit J [Alphaproteobacteria bacterium]